MKSLKTICHAFVNLIYPPLCLHCKESVLNTDVLLCQNCLQLLELIDPSERCPHCFSIDFSPENRLCFDCLKKPPLLNGIAAAFDYLGPAATLIKKLKYGDLTYLSKGCGAYLAAQFLQLNWPYPDVIIPMPISISHLMERGFNQSLLLSRDLSKILNCPVEESLIRESGDYSQAGLSRKQRQLLDGAAFFLKPNVDYCGKTLLLIDDVMTTGSSLRRCAEVLMETGPSQIYGLTFCRAIK
jgi:competence protein ComFC